MYDISSQSCNVCRIIKVPSNVVQYIFLCEINIYISNHLIYSLQRHNPYDYFNMMIYIPINLSPKPKNFSQPTMDPTHRGSPPRVIGRGRACERRAPALPCRPPPQAPPPGPWLSSLLSATGKGVCGTGQKRSLSDGVLAVHATLVFDRMAGEVTTRKWAADQCGKKSDKACRPETGSFEGKVECIHFALIYPEFKADHLFCMETPVIVIITIRLIGKKKTWHEAIS
jgi:hypothetical protein